MEELNKVILKTNLMKKALFILSSLFLLTSLTSCAEEISESADFIPLFDGKALDGWKNPYSWGSAEVVDGVIHLRGDKKFFLVTEKTYADFILEAEVLLPEGEANSGVMFRAHAEPGNVYGYQCEVDGSARNWTGGLYDEARRAWFISPKKSDPQSIENFKKRAGNTFNRDDWNRLRITCKGNQIQIEVNGVLTTDVVDEMDAKGVIGIQHHGEKGKVYRFRNIRIKEL